MRLTILAGIVGVAAIAWAYLLADPAGMSGGGMKAMALKPWSWLDFFLMFGMWAVMMVAMMLPSAAPAVLLFAAISKKIAAPDRSGRATAFFAGAYLIAWSAFSLGATGLQWGLERLALLSPTMVSSSASLGGVLLIAAGIYQWTPAKDACLTHCRTPLQFLSEHWRAGNAGALRMGLLHGLYCIGCCWAIMGLLFVGGVMNLLWVAAIAVFVLIEKAAPFGRVTGRIAGVALAIGGIYGLASGALL
ncbi:MAG: DUF2182 domain-containing protein [Alphaproteobacteria bacterium]